ncbi:hypothetical protein BN2476_70064 [Paraburkholderia piptadeniae]|uniref:Transposase n=1 Tax=Paraburkholderia piptadeniae TaxID=1701573 RepID=A0A1N7RLC1_9BURK|nr:hypothetical protein BN2476_70064 [Paraburkholderia piptadeniae]
MGERGIEVDHSSVRRWVIKLVSLFEKAFHKCKRPVRRKDGDTDRTGAAQFYSLMI